MAKRRKTPRGVRFGKPVTMGDLRKTVQHAEVLIGMADRNQEELEALGIDTSALDDLRGAKKELQELEVPSARAMMATSLGDGMTKELVLTLYHRTVRGLHALAPIIAMRLAGKIDDHQAPGSTRVLLEMAKGLGLLIPAEPIAAKNRMDLMDEKALRSQPTEQLKDAVLGNL